MTRSIMSEYYQWIRLRSNASLSKTPLRSGRSSNLDPTARGFCEFVGTPIRPGLLTGSGKWRIVLHLEHQKSFPAESHETVPWRLIRYRKGESGLPSTRSRLTIYPGTQGCSLDPPFVCDQGKMMARDLQQSREASDHYRQADLNSVWRYEMGIV
jgi:hypothetical protein